MEERLDRMEERLDRMEERLNRMEERLDKLEEKNGGSPAHTDESKQEEVKVVAKPKLSF